MDFFLLDKFQSFAPCCKMYCNADTEMYMENPQHTNDRKLHYSETKDELSGKSTGSHGA